MDFIGVVQSMVRTGKDCISLSLRCHCVLATSIEFSPRPFNTSAMSMVRPGHVVEDSITLFTRSFGSLHVCCMFAAGSHRVYVTLSEFSITSGSNSSHHHLCFNYDLNRNQQFLLLLVLLQGHQTLLDAQAALRRFSVVYCWIQNQLFYLLVTFMLSSPYKLIFDVVFCMV